MDLLKLTPLFTGLLIIGTLAKAQSSAVFFKPASFQHVSDTVIVNVLIPSETPLANVSVWSFNENTLTTVEKKLAYDSVNGYYTARLPITGFPDDTLYINLSGLGLTERIYVIHDASLNTVPGTPTEIIVEKPLAQYVANSFLPVKAKVIGNTDSLHLLLSLFVKEGSTMGKYVTIGSYLNSVDTAVDFSAYYGKTLYLLIHAIDSNKQVTALPPIPVYVETSLLLSKYFVTNGRIIDFNYNKLLVADDGPQPNLRIVDVHAGTSVNIPSYGRIHSAWLTPQGVVFSTYNDSLYDYNNGNLLAVAPLVRGSLRVAGNHCIWTYGAAERTPAIEIADIYTNTLFYRNFVNKTVTTVSSYAATNVGPATNINSVQENGTILYADSIGSIIEYTNGAYSVKVPVNYCANPVGNNFSVVYTTLDNRLSEIRSTKGKLTSDLIGVTRAPLLDYQVNGIYKAYTHVAVDRQASKQIRRSDTAYFNDGLVTSSSFTSYIDLLAPTGDFMYIAVKRYLALLSGGITEINNGQGKTYYRDSIWYLSIGNTLFRLGASASPDIITNDTIYHTVLSAYNFADTDFTENFGPSPLIAVKITGLPRHGLLKKTGAPVMLNDVIITADLNKLTYEPDAGFAFVDTIQWSGSNGLVYAGNALLKIIVVPLPAKPAFTGIMADYCNGLGLQHVRISNWPDISFTSVKAMLDSTPLTINAADSSFSFNVNGLGAGVHQIRVTFTNIAGTKDSVVSTTIIAAVMPDVNVSANITNIISLTNPVILTASNAAGGGTTPLFTFAKNRTFTDILQTEGTSTTFTINPSALVIGDNKVYVRMKTNATCYTVQADTDSILLKRDATTGIIDPDNPGGTISIAPIPFQNNIRVDGLNSGKKYQLVMSNMRGQIVYSAQVSNKSSISIPATGIVPGAYWLSIYDAKKKLLGTEKVIKY